MKPRLALPSVAAILVVGCAMTQPVSSERQSELQARAQECMRAHPEVQRYEVDRFGTVTAYYRMTGSATATTAPFFDCVLARK
jgi:hypothetical protein